MSKPTAPTAPIMLDRERHLLINFNTLALIEEKTGKNTLRSETWQNISASDLRVFLWACLLHEDPELTLEQVGAMLTMDKVAEITAALQAAASASFPPASGEAKNPTLPTG
ncbi:MAG: hypothetical protein ACM3XZ_05145 [Betaproteobacteria bacterium]